MKRDGWGPTLASRIRGVRSLDDAMATLDADANRPGASMAIIAAVA